MEDNIIYTEIYKGTKYTIKALKGLFYVTAKARTYEYPIGAGVKDLDKAKELIERNKLTIL
jgi:hypothetical protein